VQGEAHRRTGVGNQDSWRGASGSFGSIVVVADGLGSRRFAKESSRAACNAAVQVVRSTGTRAVAVAASALLIDIERQWTAELQHLPETEIGTTCLLSWRRPDRSVLLAGVGDGVCLGGGAEVVVEGASGWLNESESICHGSWSIAEVPESRGPVLLATDGVAADLIPGSLPWLTDHLVATLGQLDRSTAWRRLARDLRSWRTPGLGDDRTIVVHLS